MTKLVSLYGRPGRLGAPPQYQFSLFSMSGSPGEAVDPTKMNPAVLKDPILTVDPRELSNVDAGIQALYTLAFAYPGLTFGQLLEKTGRLSGIFGDFGNWVSKTVGNAGDKLGEWGGDFVRLVTDREVRDGLKDYAAAYYTGGASAGVQGMMGQGGKEAGMVDQAMAFLSNLGKGQKQNAAQIQQAGFGGMNFSDPKIIAMGMGGIILLVLLLNK